MRHSTLQQEIEVGMMNRDASLLGFISVQDQIKSEQKMKDVITK